MIYKKSECNLIRLDAVKFVDSPTIKMGRFI